MVSGSGSTSRREGWLSSTKYLGRRPQNRAIKRKGTDPKTGLLNVKRLIACLLLWVARFPSCLVLVLACARAWSVGPLGAFALFLVLCALWATTRKPILSSRFDKEVALLYRYLSTPVYVRVIRCHLQGARVIVAYTSMGGSQVVHSDAFILEFLALPSFLFVQVVAIAAIMLVFDFFASSNGNLNDITLVHVKMNIAVVGSTNLTTISPLTTRRASTA